MAKTPQEIDATATAMQQAGAPDEDIRAYVQAALAESQAQPAAAPAAPEQAAPTFMQRLGSAIQGAGGVGFQQTGLEAPATQADADVYYPALAQGLRKGAATGAMLAPMAVTGAGLPMAVGIGARSLAGLGGYLASNAIEGEKPTLSGAAQNMILSGAPLPPSISAPLFSAKGLANIPIGAAGAATTVAAGHAVGQSLDDKKMSWDRYKESLWNDSLAPAAISAAALWGGGKLQSMSKLQAEVDAGRKFTEEMGITHPMLGDVMPKFGEMQQRVVAANPAMLAKQEASRAPMAKSIYGLIADAPMNETIAARIIPFTKKLDELDASYAQMLQRKNEAIAVRQKAEAATNLSDDVKAKIFTGANAEEMEAVQAMALNQIQMQALGQQLGSNTDHASAITTIVKDGLFPVRSRIAGDKLAQVGIPKGTPIISKDELVQGAIDGMGPEASKTDAGKQVISIIKSYGDKTAEDAVIAAETNLQAARRRSDQAIANGQTPSLEDSKIISQEVFGFPKNKYQLGTAPKAPEPSVPAAMPTPPENTHVSLDRFQELRNGLSEGFSGSMVSNDMSGPERIMANAYRGMGQAVRGKIAENPAYNVGAYDDFLNFWSKTSQLRDSKFGRSLFRGEVSAPTVIAMAEKLAKGDKDEVKNFTDFVSAIRAGGEGAVDSGVRETTKSVADSVMATMGSAVRNSFLEQAYDKAAGSTDFRQLFNNLHATFNRPGQSNVPFPVDQLGFGDLKSIAGAQKALRQYAPHDLTPKAIEGVFESPQMQLAMKYGSADMPDILKQQLSTAAFNKRVQDAVILKENGFTKEANKAFADAAKHADAAALDASTVESALSEARKNPLTSVFAGRGASYRLGNEGSNLGSEGSITSLVTGLPRGDARAFMKKLKETAPDLHEMVSSRVAADVLEGFKVAQSKVPGQTYSIDPQKVREYFSPNAVVGDKDTRFSKLEAVIGEEAAAKLKRQADLLVHFKDSDLTSRIAAKNPIPEIEAVRFGRTVASGSPQAGSSGANVLQRAQNWYREGRFDYLSRSLLDKGFSNSLNRNADNVADALADMPPSRAWMLLQDTRFRNDGGKPTP